MAQPVGLERSRLLVPPIRAKRVWTAGDRHTCSQKLHEQAESNDRPDRRRERGARDRSLTQRQGAITAAAVEPQALAACLTAGAWSSIDFGIAQTTPFIFATELYLAGLAG